MKISKLFKFIFLLLNLLPLLSYLLLPHLPLLIHPLSPLFGRLPVLAGVLGLSEDSIRLKGMILFELLIHHCFLFEFLPLLRLMIVMQACECLLRILSGWGLPLRGDSLWVECALSQFNVIF